MSEVKRKGSRSIKDIPADIMSQLNAGEIETANLVEWLAIDQKLLLQNLLKELGKEHYLESILVEVVSLKKHTVNTVNEVIGIGLLRNSKAENDTTLFDKLAHHSSDCVRCWAAYLIAFDDDLSLAEKLAQIEAFAADAHFGVREIAWLTMRRSISENLNLSIELLSKWTNHEDENVRRFASEATRPRGVWCAHIDDLKQNPQMALTILDPLKSDSSKYVQNSVANWLNDASKTKAEFVIDLCNRWKNESPTAATQYIISRALRTLEK